MVSGQDIPFPLDDLLEELWLERPNAALNILRPGDHDLGDRGSLRPTS